MRSGWPGSAVLKQMTYGNHREIILASNLRFHERPIYGFAKSHSDTGFKGNRLQEVVNIEKGQTFFTNTEKMKPEKKVIDSPKGVPYNPSLSVEN